MNSTTKESKCTPNANSTTGGIAVPTKGKNAPVKTLRPHPFNIWWEFLSLFNYVPKFLGVEMGHKGEFYTEFYNPQTKMRYLRDNMYGTVWLR